MTQLQNFFIALVNMDIFEMTLSLNLNPAYGQASNPLSSSGAVGGKMNKTVSDHNTEQNVKLSVLLGTSRPLYIWWLVSAT